MVFRRTNGEIAWSCDACGDEGVICGWEGSPADVSALDDSYTEGDTVTLLIARELFEVIRGVLLLDDACELLVARAEGNAADRGSQPRDEAECLARRLEESTTYGLTHCTTTPALRWVPQRRASIGGPQLGDGVR